MKIVLARLNTALAIALTNGDTKASDQFKASIDQITPFAVDPYILPDVLVPPAPVVPATVQEVHDAVQAGTITPQQAVDAGVIKSVDAIPPVPVAPSSDAVQLGSSDSAGPATVAPVVSVDPAVQSDASAPAATVTQTPAPAVDPAPVVASVDTPAASVTPPPVTDPAAAPVADRLTADEARITALEQASGKVSRQ